VLRVPEAHVVACGVLGFLLGLARDRRGSGPAAVLLVASASVVGGLDERLQAGLDGRTAERGDRLADTIDAGTGFGAALLLRARRRGPGNR
jgi:VanZ family protein